MASAIEQFRTYYAGLQPGQRGVLLGAALLSIASLVGVGWWSWGDRYEVVYSANDPLDVQEVVSALETQNIPFRIVESGRAIEVLPEDLGRARIAGAAAGKVLGFEVLDSIELGSSPQRERWAFQRALQGELVRTISALDQVEWARVHLALPDRTAFLRDETPPSASITVKLRPGAVLSAAEVRGITALVSGAVDGLHSNDVVLVNQDGALLSGGDAEAAEAALGGGPALMGLRTTEEKRTRNAIRDALTRVLGSPDDITVGVTVDVAASSIDQFTRSKDPDSQVLISETIREQSGESVKPGGIPGTASNLPEQGGSSAATSKESLQEQRSNFDYTTVETREQSSAGAVKRLSIGVFVNSDRIVALATAVATAANAGKAPDAAAIQAQIDAIQKQVEDTVRVAAGYNKERGDSVQVSFVPFSATADVGSTPSEEPAALVALERYLPYLIVLVAMALLFWFVIRPLVGAVTRASGGGGLQALEAGAIGLDGRRILDGPGAARTDAAGRNLTERLRAMVDNFETVDAADLNRLVDLEQEATAQVLRRWIRES